MTLSLKNNIKEFFGFIKSKKFLLYSLSLLLFALVFFHSGYAMTNNGTYRTYFFAILILFAVCLLGYYLVTIPIPNDKKTLKSILLHYFKLASKDISFYYLLFVVFATLLSVFVNHDYGSNGIKAFISNLSLFLAAFLFAKVVSFKKAIWVFNKIFPWLCLVSLGLFAIINVFDINQPFMSFDSSVVQYDNYFFVYFRYVSLNNRNCSIFWEPALFALFLCLGIVLESISATNKIRWWVIVVYLVSLVTTFSSTGFLLLFAVIILSILALKNEIIKKNFVEFLVLLGVCIAGMIIVFVFKPSIMQKFILSPKNGSLIDRLYGPIINFRIMLDHPFGVGFSNEYSYFLEYAEASEYNFNNVIQTCAFGYWSSAFGYLGLAIAIIPLVFLFFNKKIDIFTKLMIVPTSILFMMAEPIQNNLAFLILIFYCLEEVRLPAKKPVLATENVGLASSISERFLTNKNNSIFAKNSISTFVVRGFAMLVSLFTTAAYISYFADPRGEGMLAVWFTILSILTWIFVFDLGVGNGLKNKLIAAYEKNDKKNIKTLVSSSYFFAFVVSLAILAVGTLVIYLISPYALLNTSSLLIKEDALKLSLLIILIGVCLNFVLKIVCNIFESLQKQGLANIFAVFHSLILIIFTSTFFFETNEERMIGLAIAYLIASSVPLLIGSIILFLTKFKEFKPSFKSISREGIKSVVSLGGLFFIIQICMLLIINTNTILVQHLFSSIESGATSQFTYYQKLFNVIIVVSQLLCGPLWVIIAKARSSGDSNYVRKMNKMIIVLASVFIVLDLVLFGTMPLILQIWIPNAEFTFSWVANAVFALNALVITSTALFTTISNGLSKLKYQVVGFVTGVAIKAVSIVTIVLLLNSGKNIPWYVVEMTTTLSYLPVLVLVPIGNHKYLKEINSNSRAPFIVYSYEKQRRNNNLVEDSLFTFLSHVKHIGNKTINFNSFAHIKRDLRKNNAGEKDILILSLSDFSDKTLKNIKRKYRIKMIIFADSEDGLEKLKYANALIYKSKEILKLSNISRPSIVYNSGKDFKNKLSELVRKISDSKRILIVNNSYGGSTGNLSRMIANRFLSNGDDVKFYYVNGPKNGEYYAFKYGFNFERYASAFMSRIDGKYLGYMFMATASLKKITGRFDPDIVNIHCMNAYSLNNYNYFEYLKTNNFKTVIVNHALFYATGSCGYPYNSCEQYKTGCVNCPNKRYSCKSIFIDGTNRNWKMMHKIFEGSNFEMVSVSQYVKQFCLSSPLTSNLNNKVILNGIDTDIFKYKKTHFKGNKTHILSVCSDIYGINKGFNEFLRIVDAFAHNNDYVFHLVCPQKVRIASRDNLIIHNNVISRKEMAELYTKSDLFLLTSKNETFSLPVAESVCCGTPVLAFQCGGPESILTKDVAKFVKFGDIDAVIRYIKLKEYQLIDRNYISKYGIEHFSMKDMCDNYFSLFNRIVKKD